MQSKRILIVSEAGTGKTYECRTEQQERLNAGEAAFYFELAELGAGVAIAELFSDIESKRYDQWTQSQGEDAIIFLDSVDELKLTRRSFETALRRLNRELSGKLDRARIVITTRPIPFDEQLIRQYLPVPEIGPACDAASFADTALGNRNSNSKTNDLDKKPEEWRRVELLPLSDDQIIHFVPEQGVTDPKSLLQKLKDKHAEEFARRPQDLIEICSDWSTHGVLRTYREQVESNIELKLRPRAPDARNEWTHLEPEKAMDGATRLALAMLLTRRFSLRHGVESDSAAQTEVALDPQKILVDWTADDCRTLLERPLFGFAGYGRVRFNHRSSIEFLAAKHFSHLLAAGCRSRLLREYCLPKRRREFRSSSLRCDQSLLGWP